MSNSPLQFKVMRTILDLGKQLLVLIEDLCDDSERARDSLEQTILRFNITETDQDLLIAIINQGFTLNQNKKAGLRKRVLDLSNSAVRTLDSEFNRFNIQINHNQ